MKVLLSKALGTPSRRQIGMGIVALTALESGCAGLSSEENKVHVVMNFADQTATAAPNGPGETPTLIRTAVDANLRMTAPVFLDGKGPFDFVVDTGANVSVLSIELASSLGLQAGPVALVHGIAGVLTAATVKIARLSVGSVHSSDLLTPIMPEQALGGDGILGVDVLKDRLVQLDFQFRRLWIGRSGHFNEPATPSIFQATSATASRIGRSDAETLVVVPARYRFGQLTVVDAAVGGLPITAFLDSGSETTVGNGPLLNGFGRKRPDLLRRSRTVQLLSATGQTAIAQIAPLPVLRLGGLRLSNLSAAFANLHAFELWGLADRPAILIGMDILRHFNMVELDFGGRQVRFHIASEALG